LDIDGVSADRPVNPGLGPSRHVWWPQRRRRGVSGAPQAAVQREI